MKKNWSLIEGRADAVPEEIKEVNIFLEQLECGEIEKPGVLIIGPDFNDEKDALYRLFADWRWDYAQNNAVLAYPVVMLDGNKSCDHSERHKAVMDLIGDGVKNVILVYLHKDIEECADCDQIHRQALVLSENPPNEDGIYCLISVKSEC